MTRRLDEPTILHLSNEITYCLREKIRWDIISTPFCFHLTRSRTIWTNKQKETLSVYHSAFIRCNYIPPMGENVMSTHLCTYATRKHTICRSKGKETQSGHHSESILRDHILPVSESTRRHDKWIFLHLSGRITYFLVHKYEKPWAQYSAAILRDYLLPIGGNTMSTTFYTDLTRSRTSCGQKRKMIPSSGHYSSIQRDHVRSVGENTLKHHEHITLHRSDPITYDLWAKTWGETMSTLSWSIRRNYAHPMSDKTISTGSAPSNGNTHHLLLRVDI